MLLEGVLRVREQGDGAIRTWVGSATSDGAEKTSVSLLVVAQGSRYDGQLTQVSRHRRRWQPKLRQH
jgi:hypothetical protein